MVPYTKGLEKGLEVLDMATFLVTEEDIETLRRRLKEELGDGYEVEAHKEVSALMGAVKEIFDLVVFYHDDAICGIEYKYKAGGSLIYERFQDVLINRFSRVGLKYGAAYTGSRGLYLWTKGSYKIETFSFENFVIAIKGNQTCGARILPDKIIAKFKSFIPDNLNIKLSRDLIAGIEHLITDDNLKYNEKSASVWLTKESEDSLFKIMLQSECEEEEYMHVCRYTSLNSLFLSIKNGSQAMCSITCMNDKGETSYADKKVGYGSYASTPNSIKENNDCFILSCCNKDMVDNLTMWRLYGNDGKGVCLEYDVDLSKIDNKEFFFAPISYGTGMNEHPVLDFIQKIRHWKDNGWCFELKRWFIWKHFFKSYLYKEEKEVRLLYYWTEDSKDRVEWIMDSTNNIASRLCIFSLTDDRFPLKLKNAIVGPKCPEQGSNVDQFNYMNRVMRTMHDSWLKPAVKPSRIEDYR